MRVMTWIRTLSFTIGKAATEGAFVGKIHIVQEVIFNLLWINLIRKDHSHVDSAFLLLAIVFVLSSFLDNIAGALIGGATRFAAPTGIY